MSGTAGAPHSTAIAKLAAAAAASATLAATIAAISPICPTMRGATLREGRRFLVVAAAVGASRTRRQRNSPARPDCSFSTSRSMKQGAPPPDRGVSGPDEAPLERLGLAVIADNRPFDECTNEIADRQTGQGPITTGGEDATEPHRSSPHRRRGSSSQHGEHGARRGTEDQGTFRTRQGYPVTRLRRITSAASTG